VRQHAVFVSGCNVKIAPGGDTKEMKDLWNAWVGTICSQAVEGLQTRLAKGIQSAVCATTPDVISIFAARPSRRRLLMWLAWAD
jgi:hypothetical protein